MSRMMVLAIPVATLLAACASPEMDAKKGAEICKQSGIDEGTPAFSDCVGRQVAKLEESRAQFGQALAIGMQTYGQGARQYSTPMPSYSPPRRIQTNCTSNQVGTYVYTNCY
jgi:hypothetical protein